MFEEFAMGDLVDLSSAPRDFRLMPLADPVSAWRAEEALGVSGWDFSHIAERSQQIELPWSYAGRARELIAGATRLLDIDTGGGEVLAGLAPLPRGAQALEGWPPNVAVAAARLADLGVTVTQTPGEGVAWPYDDGAFDLILNRQGHLNAGQISRVLRRGGRFLTQQVGAGNLAELAELFGGPRDDGGNTLAKASAALAERGLTITEARAWTGRQSFSDVGALVWFLKAVPWIVPGFSVDAHLPVLKAMHERLEAGEALSFRIERFWIEALG